MTLATGSMDKFSVTNIYRHAAHFGHQKEYMVTGFEPMFRGSGSVSVLLCCHSW